MSYLRFDFSFDAPKRQDCSHRRERRSAPALQRDRMQDETLGLDRIGALSDTCCNMNLEAGLAGGASHRQAVHQERKILIDDV